MSSTVGPTSSNGQLVGGDVASGTGIVYDTRHIVDGEGGAVGVTAIRDRSSGSCRRTSARPATTNRPAA